MRELIINADTYGYSEEDVQAMKARIKECEKKPDEPQSPPPANEAGVCPASPPLAPPPRPRGRPVPNPWGPPYVPPPVIIPIGGIGGGVIIIAPAPPNTGTTPPNDGCDGPYCPAGY